MSIQPLIFCSVDPPVRPSHLKFFGGGNDIATWLNVHVGNTLYCQLFVIIFMLFKNILILHSLTASWTLDVDDLTVVFVLVFVSFSKLIKLKHKVMCIAANVTFVMHTCTQKCVTCPF